MKELELSVQDITSLMNTFAKSGLGSLRIKQGDFSLRLEGKKIEQVVAREAVQAVGEVAAAPPQTAVPEAPPSGNVVTSPIVGTFYAAPSPDKAPYVRVGSEVRKGDVLFIIESMKLMNEVMCEHDGTVTEIFVQNEQGVEYGQPILTIA